MNEPSSDWYRPPVVAGSFYTDDPVSLRSEVERFLAGGEPWNPVAVVAPHAGYRYSGALAGLAFRGCRVPDEVILLCPNHTGRGRPLSVWGRGTWETPLGRVPVAEGRAARLLERLQLPPDRGAHHQEHAIEVLLPFLQVANPNVTIVPVVLGALSWEQVERVSDALGAVGAGALLVASTDFSHYIPAATARELDGRALACVESLDGAGLYRTVRQEGMSMCGFIPTAVVLRTCRGWGYRKAEILGYGHSGEVTGDERWVVGYGAARVVARANAGVP